MSLPKTSSELTTIVGINGMSCAACTASVETAIRRVSDVKEATVNLATEQATVIYLSRPNIIKEILNASIKLIENTKLNNSDLMKIIKGPDFPTGGVLVDSSKTILEKEKQIKLQCNYFFRSFFY